MKQPNENVRQQEVSQKLKELVDRINNKFDALDEMTRKLVESKKQLVKHDKGEK